MAKIKREHDYKKIFGYKTYADFADYQWPDDIKREIDALMAEHYTPYTDEKPDGWIMARFKEAAEELDITKRCELLLKVKADAFTQYHTFKPKYVAPMPDDVKEMLKELNATKRAARPTTVKVPKKEKKPVFLDRERQAELCTKYEWAIAGSFVADPEKSGGTLVSIKCQVCGKDRQIHLSDLFQVKKCKECKSK